LKGDLPLNRSVQIAFSGMLTALGVAFLCAAGLIPVATYALPALSGALLMPIVVELGAKWAWPVFLATGILGLLLGPDKEAVFLYILFFGYYPIIKAIFERHGPKWEQWIFKFGVFNASMIVAYFISIYFLGIPEESFEIIPGMPLWLLLAGNVVFVIYDYALSGLVGAYVVRFHSMISKWLHAK
jgi:hypothetical protein